MRAIVAIESIGTAAVLALDEDGYLWRGTLGEAVNGVVQADWEPIRGPDDAPPLMDTRSELDLLEERIRRDVQARDALRAHLDGLPGVADSENVT